MFLHQLFLVVFLLLLLLLLLLLYLLPFAISNLVLIQFLCFNIANKFHSAGICNSPAMANFQSLLGKLKFDQIQIAIQ